MSTQTRNTIILTFTALIWGFAFIAQSMGAGIGAFTFVASRNWLGALVLIPVMIFFEAKAKKENKVQTDVTPAVKKNKMRFLIFAGMVCGFILFAASSSQQFAMTLSASAAKAGFITTMYVVIVPLIGNFFGKRTGLQIWLCVAVAVGGLYFLCMTKGWEGVETSDLFLLLCALLFSLQILAIDHFSPLVDSIHLSFFQFLFTAIFATISAFLFEAPTLIGILENAGPILYCGILSSGVAFTLQVIAQKDLNPTIASIAMCMESVFAALGGWLILSQTLTIHESIGCALIFGAVVFAQIPVKQLLKKKSVKN